MEKELNENIKQLAQKLDVIAALLLKIIPKNGEGLLLKDQITLLDGLGVRPTDVSKIIGRPINYVSKELAGIRKKKNNK